MTETTTPLLEKMLDIIARGNINQACMLVDHLTELDHPATRIVSEAVAVHTARVQSYRDKTKKPRRGLGVWQEIAIQHCVLRTRIARAFKRHWKGTWDKRRRKYADRWSRKTQQWLWDVNDLTPENK